MRRLVGKQQDVDVGTVGAGVVDALGSLLEVGGFGVVDVGHELLRVQVQSGNQVLCTCTMMRWPRRKV